jgi:hypothetical protein
MSVNGRNLRLLGEERSPAWQPTTDEIISELQAELAKGTAVYSNEELARLERKLADYRLLRQRLDSP